MNELTLKSAALARTDSRVWDEFIKAFKEYADAQKDVCVQSSEENLRMAQGRARQCVELISLFEGAVKTADRMSTRRQ